MVAGIMLGFIYGVPFYREMTYGSAEEDIERRQRSVSLVGRKCSADSAMMRCMTLVIKIYRTFVSLLGAGRSGQKATQLALLWEPTCSKAIVCGVILHFWFSPLQWCAAIHGTASVVLLARATVWIEILHVVH